MEGQPMILLTTKLHIPQVRSALVARPHLTDKLTDGMESKLTLITAPAGYGKTTLMSEWVKHCDAFVAWVSLDRHDNEFVQFWSYVIAAIKKAHPKFGDSALLFLSNAETSSTESFIAVILNELNSLSSELVIVLDDFHVIHQSAVNDSIAYLLEYLPPHVHLLDRFD